MLVAALRIVLTAVLLVGLPGLLLVHAFLPPGRGVLRRAERLILALPAGVLLLMLVGVLLGSRPGGLALFSPVPVAVAMAAASVGLFVVAWRRGAYPRLRASGRPAAGPGPGPARSPR